MTSKRTAAERLSLAIIAGLILLAPLFFTVMFTTVTTFVRPWFGPQAPAVPLATEGCFVLLYLMDIRAAMAARPLRGLRLPPYLFAGLSLWLNAYAGHGHLGSMVAHAAVTAAFFGPLLAGETLLRRLTVPDEDHRYAAELADARAFARDLLRTCLPWWQRAPRLLRRQLRSGRLPHEVQEAIRAGAAYAGPAAWQPAIRKMVAGSLTPPPAAPPAASPPQPAAKRAGRTTGRKPRATPAQRAAAIRAVAAGRAYDEVAAELGVHPGSVRRWIGKAA